MSTVKFYHPEGVFELESGKSLKKITIAYHTYGKLNADRSNVLWVCHALTADSDAAGWWPGVIGMNGGLDREKYFIVCANILGSCYGSSGPLSTDPQSGKIYYSSFPMITIRDMVKAHILLRRHLGIEKIHLLMGGSLGGYQALEWCVMEQEVIQNVLLLATAAAESAWGIAIHSAQRFAIEADGSWRNASENAGEKGLKAARAIGMLTYRNYALLVKQQTDPDNSKIDNFRASSYMEHQGQKLVARFNAYSYWLLTKAMDSHNLARSRGELLSAQPGTIETVLAAIKARTLIIGISSDILCPLPEQHFLAAYIPDVTLVEIDSTYGHDGFIIEAEKICSHLKEWLKEN